MAQDIRSPLSTLSLQLISPSPLLRPYIQSYWRCISLTPLTQYQEEFMHPLGGFGLVFNLGHHLQMDQQILGDPVFFDGVNTRSRKMGFEGHIDLLGVRFHVGGAFPFIGIPLGDLVRFLMMLVLS